MPGATTCTARLRRAIAAVADFCRRRRYQPVKEQHAKLKVRLVGHYNYFGINGNSRSLERLRHAVTRAWHKWLSRRSQRARLSWERFTAGILRVFPLPRPRIAVQLWTP